MFHPIPYYLSEDIIPQFIAFCQQKGFSSFFLIADKNTYTVLGSCIEKAVLDQGWKIKTILFSDDEIVTNEHFLVRAQVETGGESRCFLAVGSGTITDITRFVSHRSHDPFISIPTAPSVDGFTSTVAPMVVGNYKSPVPAQPPLAVFANIPTLCAAPRKLIAAGLGDLLGKYTSLADWKIGSLVYDEPYDDTIARQMRLSVDETIEVVDQIASGSDKGIARLTDGLVGSGFGMLAFGDSRPASGSEHHIGHFWEMKLIIERRPASLHGAEVGVATILSASRYASLRKMSFEEAKNALKSRELPSLDEMRLDIEAGYSVVAPIILRVQAPLFTMTREEFEKLKMRILTNWDAIQSIAQSVPEPEEISGWIEKVGGPVSPSQLNLDMYETWLGLAHAHYLRDRFTINRLGFWLNLPMPEISN